MERPFFQQKLKPVRIGRMNIGRTARIGRMNIHTYHPELILLPPRVEFDLLIDQSRQSNTEAKQGQLQLDRYRPFACQQGNLLINPRDLEWIPKATDILWANSSGWNPKFNIIASPHWYGHYN